MTLHATPDQLERLIEAGKALAAEVRAFADDIDESEREPFVDEVCRESAMLLDKADSFDAIRVEIEGIQHTIGSV